MKDFKKLKVKLKIKENNKDIKNLVIINKKKKNEKKGKYSDFARKLRKLLNMRMTEIPIIIGALGTNPRRLGKGLETLEITGQIKTIIKRQHC